MSSPWLQHCSPRSTSPVFSPLNVNPSQPSLRVRTAPPPSRYLVDQPLEREDRLVSAVSPHDQGFIASTRMCNVLKIPDYHVPTITLPQTPTRSSDHSDVRAVTPTQNSKSSEPPIVPPPPQSLFLDAQYCVVLLLGLIDRFGGDWDNERHQLCQLSSKLGLCYQNPAVRSPSPASHSSTPNHSAKWDRVLGSPLPWKRPAPPSPILKTESGMSLSPRTANTMARMQGDHRKQMEAKRPSRIELATLAASVSPSDVSAGSADSATAAQTLLQKREAEAPPAAEGRGTVAALSIEIQPASAGSSQRLSGTMSSGRLSSVGSSRKGPSPPNLLDKTCGPTSVSILETPTPHSSPKEFFPAKVKSEPKRVGPSAQEVLMEMAVLSNAEDPAHRYIFNPNGIFLRVWNLCVAVLLLQDAFILPYRIAFVGAVQPGWLAFDIVVDLVFFVDIVIHFRTRHKDISSGLWVSDPSQIANRYFRGWFLVDFVSVLPIYYLFLDTGTGSSLYKFPRLVRLLRLSRLLRLLRLVHISRQLSRLSSLFTNNLLLMQMTKFVVAMLTIAHWIACVWYLSASLDDFGPETWVVRNSLLYEDETHLYITSLYWSLITMTTVGYGDIHAESSAEKILTLFTVLLGTSAFGYIVGNITSLVNDANSPSLLFRARMRQINEYMSYRNLPPKIRRRVVKFYDRFWSRRLAFNETEILTELSRPLRKEIVRHIVGDVVNKLPLFRGRDEAFMSRVLLCFVFEMFGAGDIIFHEGDVADDMYVICNGSVHIVDEEGKLVSVYGVGQFFGEVALLFDVRRTATALAHEDCELLKLSRSDMQKLVREDGDFETVLQSLAQERYARVQKAALEREERRRNSLPPETEVVGSAGSQRASIQRRATVF